MDKFPITAAGHAALEAEFLRRQQVERPRIIAAISEARSHGDLSENAEYHSAKEAQSHNEGRIVELEDLLQRAEVIDVSKLSGSTIKFGATVTLIDEDTEKQRSFQIVGENEADVKIGQGLDHLADRPRADRQEGRRHRRGEHARRRQELRDPQGRLYIARPRSQRAVMDNRLHGGRWPSRAPSSGSRSPARRLRPLPSRRRRNSERSRSTSPISRRRGGPEAEWIAADLPGRLRAAFSGRIAPGAPAAPTLVVRMIDFLYLGPIRGRRRSAASAPADTIRGRWWSRPAGGRSRRFRCSRARSISPAARSMSAGRSAAASANSPAASPNGFRARWGYKTGMPGFSIVQ